MIVSAGASDAGREFAGRYADCIFMPGRTPRDELQARVADIRRHGTSHGRCADDITVQMHVSLIVRETEREATELSRWVAENVDMEAVGEYLNGARSQISTYDDIYAQLV